MTTCGEYIAAYQVFFPIVDTCRSCEDIAEKFVRWCPDGDFSDFLCPVFSASHVQRVSDLHLKFALTPHHVWQLCAGMADIQSAPAEIRQGKKEERKKIEQTTENIMVCPIL